MRSLRSAPVLQIVLHRVRNLSCERVDRVLTVMSENDGWPPQEPREPTISTARWSAPLPQMRLFMKEESTGWW